MACCPEIVPLLVTVTAKGVREKSEMAAEPNAPVTVRLPVLVTVEPLNVPLAWPSLKPVLGGLRPPEPPETVIDPELVHDSMSTQLAPKADPVAETLKLPVLTKPPPGKLLWPPAFALTPATLSAPMMLNVPLFSNRS